MEAFLRETPLEHDLGVGLAVIVLIFWKVIPQIGSYSDALAALEGMGGAAMLLVGISVLIYLVAYGFPFMAATPGLSYGHSFQLNQGAFAISKPVARRTPICRREPPTDWSSAPGTAHSASDTAIPGSTPAWMVAIILDGVPKFIGWFRRC